MDINFNNIYFNMKTIIQSIFLLIIGAIVGYYLNVEANRQLLENIKAELKDLKNTLTGNVVK